MAPLTEARGSGSADPESRSKRDTLTVTDNRTGKTYELPIEHGAIKTMDLRQIKTDADDFGLMGHDPAFMNTSSCRSKVTFIDGDKGILNYRGYPIDQLAESSTHLEVAYLLLNGELPKKPQLESFVNEIKMHTFVHENMKKFQEGFRHDANPMAMFISSVAAMSTFYSDASDVDNAESRRGHMIRLLAKVPTIAAWAYRHTLGLPYVYPDNELSFTGNFLAMIFKMSELKYKPTPAIERAFDVLFILHADHEQNCSANAMRAVGSSRVDPYSAMAGAAAALYGPLHGGANAEVLYMLQEIKDKSRVPDFVKRVKNKEAKLMGFGHRVYKNYDPRAKIIKKATDDVFEVTGTNPLLDIALELERIALEDDYFVARKLYPNVDFY
ncbi:MAG: citrate/2-methylcitrate synthase, partial [Planctomycetota bacterium]